MRSFGEILVQTFFVLILSGISSLSFASASDIEFPFDETDQKNEFPLEEIRRAIGSKTNDKEFYYVNPAMDPSACAAPLTVEEKIAQQAGRSHERQLKGSNQLSRYRDGWLNRFIAESTWLEWFLAQYKWNHAWAFVAHPSIGAAYFDLHEIREHVWKLQEREYGNQGGESDEADAFRHFVGAGFLILRFGRENAEIILNIHEKDDVSMSSLMDRYNNEVAMSEILAMSTREEIPSPGAKLTISADIEKTLVSRAKELIARGDLVSLKMDGSRSGRISLPGGTKFRKWAHRVLEKTLD